ncbi:MAG: SusE domain-containing protein [Bacteroidota bacterium]
MKTLKYFKYLIVVSLLVGLGVSSCDGPDPEFFAEESTPIVLEDLNINLIVIDGSNPDNPGVTFNWNNGDFNQAVAEGYSVEFSSAADFSNPIEATSTLGTSSVTMSMSQLNSSAGAIGLNPLVEGTIYARVIASLGVQNELAVTSNVISFVVVPFFNYTFEDYYIVGNGTMADWNNNNNNPPLFRDGTDSNLYTYTGFFTKGGGALTDGRFKVLEVRGQWQPQWGSSYPDGSDPIETGGGIAGNPPGVDGGDPGRFGVEADGFYTFTIDFGASTYSIVPFNASGAADFTSMTLQGSGVSGGTAMTQSSFDTHIWYINSVSLVPGELQFSTNTGSTWAGTTAFSGRATEGSDTIPVVVEDDYEVWFNDLTGDYIMIPLNL